MKTRFRPVLRSYVCRDFPVHVVIWNVVLPRGTEVNGTFVGETRPTVYQTVKDFGQADGSNRPCKVRIFAMGEGWEEDDYQASAASVTAQ